MLHVQISSLFSNKKYGKLIEEKPRNRLFRTRVNVFDNGMFHFVSIDIYQGCRYSVYPTRTETEWI